MLTLIALFVATTPASSATEQQLHRAGCTPCLQCLPAHDHLAGEPPQLPDRGARPAALRGCKGAGGICCPAPETDLQGGHSPALCAAGARSIPACPAKRFILIEDIYFIVLPSEFKRFM